MQAALLQAVIVHEVVDRKQLHGGGADQVQVLDRFGGRQAGERAPLLLGHGRVHAGVALDVHLVDHRLVHRRVRPAVAAPVEGCIDDDRLGHEGRRIRLAALEVERV